MNTRSPFVLGPLLSVLLSTSMHPAAAAAAAGLSCHAESTAERRMLVELFTSDGCSSCPPANQWLSSVLAKGHTALIPVSLHVTYWNDLGWRDAYSAAFFDQRQDWYTHWATNRFSYTPELVRNGREWQGWRRQAEEPVESAGAAPVKLLLDVSPGPSAGYEVQVTVREAQASARPAHADDALVVYLYEDGIVEHPDAGELRGATLPHDHVVRGWQTLSRPGFAQPQHLHFALPPQANPARIGFVAFVQDRSSGEVLQALDRPPCGVVNP